MLTNNNNIILKASTAVLAFMFYIAVRPFFRAPAGAPSF